MGMIKLPESSVRFFKENIDEIFNTGNLAEGDWIKKLASLCSNYTSAKNSIVFNSNGSGLLAALKIFQTYMDKKSIFIQSNTMYGVKTLAITSGLDYLGSVDSGLSFLSPSHIQVEDFIKKLKNPKQSVFLITHIGGWVNPDIEKIAEICKRYGVALLEDCAHSLGSLLNGRHTGLFGDAGVYSLYSTKAIPAGEGGLLVTNNDELAYYLNKFIIYDRFEKEMDIGVNFRMSEINALLAYAVMSETENIISAKYDLANRYIKACDLVGIKYLSPTEGGQRSNLYKFILISKTNQPEDEFRHIKLRTSPVYDYTLGSDPENITSKHICLPIWFGLEEDTVLSVIDMLTAV